MDHIIETASLQVGPDHMDVALIDNSALGSGKDQTLIGRLFRSWNACRASGSGSAALPDHEAFAPRKVVTRPEQRFLFSLYVEDEQFAERLESNEEDILGRRNPFCHYTISSIFQTVMRRDAMYFRLQLELGDVVYELYRLLLPSISADGEVVRVDLGHQFARRPFQLPSEDRLLLTTWRGTV